MATQRRYRSSGSLWKRLKPVALEMRREATPAEQALWRVLRGGNLGGVKFRRQHAVGRFILDFYAPSIQLAVEVDGSVHDIQWGADAARDADLESRGIKVLRFRNDDVLNRIEWVVEELARHCGLPPAASP